MRVSVLSMGRNIICFFFLVLRNLYAVHRIHLLTKFQQLKLRAILLKYRKKVAVTYRQTDSHDVSIRVTFFRHLATEP